MELQRPFNSLLPNSCVHSFGVNTREMCKCFLPWGRVCMQHPVQMIPDLQQVPRCRLPGQEDTRTGPGPLETQRSKSPITHSGEWSKTWANNLWEHLLLRTYVQNAHKLVKVEFYAQLKWISIQTYWKKYFKSCEEKKVKCCHLVTLFSLSCPQFYRPCWDHGTNRASRSPENIFHSN